MKTDEGMIDVPGGRVWYRSVGEGGVPLLCLHGGPGMTHDYLTPLEALGDRRQVVFYDQLGSGGSDRPDDLSLWTIERFMAELDAVRDALGLDRIHLFGSSWGGMLAMQYVLDNPRRPVSLVMAGSPASAPAWNVFCQELLDEMPADERELIERLEAEDKMLEPEYEEAMMPFYHRHVCRIDPFPDFVMRTFERMSTTIYHYMAGPSEFRIIGTLKDWDIMDRLGEITRADARDRRPVRRVPALAPARGARPHPGQPARDHPRRVASELRRAARGVHPDRERLHGRGRVGLKTGA